ncbi:class A beta-lactamase-related serine hydrolase [Actinomadura logoneensis]|uniref:Class A beta-lactamase-related serine hydrolase n=1 Tax=Actinomadura logoneensis TaxID=2293572 RepID=A0A372JR54_9ACTN|nr:serine hydrolase domain-containing protein [Actinomadura logoneensis]RFU42244.1 class A beta-lactamase-related serine hydrolase [Actinomadura logoneensis]
MTTAQGTSERRPPVQGHCDPAFAAVRDVFERNFAEGREVGAAVAVYAGGRKVVDLWGGLADRRTGREWREDTPAFGFSCTKALTAAAALLLAERGAFEWDAPVTGWWPGFGVHGKEAATNEHLFTHQVGLPAFARPVTAEEAADAEARAAELAAQEPEWKSGTAHGYHALTYGWLAGHLVRHHAGMPAGEFVKKEFAPDLDLWIGAPDEVIERAARLTNVRGVRDEDGPRAVDDDARIDRLARSYLDAGSRMNRSVNNPSPGKGGFNNPVVLRAGWPSAGMLATARAFGAFYANLLAGRYVRPETLREGVRTRVRGEDLTLTVDSAFGLGFMRPSMTFFTPEAGRDSAFGHTGAGGALGLADLDADLAFAYLPNRMGDQLTGDLRAYRLAEAAYAAL